MQGLEAITAEIIATAKATAEETVTTAQNAKTARIKDLEERLATQAAEREASLAKESENVIARRLTLCGLEVRMATLGAKQAVISKAYALAFEKVRALPDGEYRDLFSRLVGKVAKDGDTVSVAEADKKRLNKKWLDGLSAKLKIKLALSPETLGASGGVIVVGQSSETDLTLDTLIGEIRTESENEVIAALFGTV